MKNEYVDRYELIIVNYIFFLLLLPCSNVHWRESFSGHSVVDKVGPGQGLSLPVGSLLQSLSGLIVAVQDVAQ